jgi:hypothetical protein
MGLPSVDHVLRAAKHLACARDSGARRLRPCERAGEGRVTASTAVSTVTRATRRAIVGSINPTSQP